MQLKTNIILLFVVIIVVVIVIILVVGAIVPGILEFQEKNVLYVEIVANIAINAWKDAVMVYVNVLKDVVNAFVMDVVNALMDVVNVFVMDVTVVANALKDVVIRGKANTDEIRNLSTSLKEQTDKIRVS